MLCGGCFRWAFNWDEEAAPIKSLIASTTIKRGCSGVHYKHRAAARIAPGLQYTTNCVYIHILRRRVSFEPSWFTSPHEQKDARGRHHLHKPASTRFIYTIYTIILYIYITLYVCYGASGIRAPRVSWAPRFFLCALQVAVCSTHILMQFNRTAPSDAKKMCVAHEILCRPPRRVPFRCTQLHSFLGFACPPRRHPTWCTNTNGLGKLIYFRRRALAVYTAYGVIRKTAN